MMLAIAPLNLSTSRDRLGRGGAYRWISCGAVMLECAPRLLGGGRGAFQFTFQ